MNTSLKKILVVEDDPDIRELVEYNLEKKGFQVATCPDGEGALTKALEFLPNLILLDIMLPGMSGLKVCQMIREEGRLRQVPIIMLSAKDEETDIVTGLELGADDYVAKPFSPKELLARIKSVLRRSEMDQKKTDVVEKESKIVVGPLSLDVERHEVHVEGASLECTLTEFKLLEALVQKPGRVFTRDQILETVAGADTFLVDRNVDVHIRALRKKLDTHSDLIQTVRGVGYKFREV